MHNVKKFEDVVDSYVLRVDRLDKKYLFCDRLSIWELQYANYIRINKFLDQAESKLFSKLVGNQEELYQLYFRYGVIHKTLNERNSIAVSNNRFLIWGNNFELLKEQAFEFLVKHQPDPKIKQKLLYGAEHFTRSVYLEGDI